MNLTNADIGPTHHQRCQGLDLNTADVRQVIIPVSITESHDLAELVLISGTKVQNLQLVHLGMAALAHRFILDHNHKLALHITPVIFLSRLFQTLYFQDRVYTTVDPPRGPG